MSMVLFVCQHHLDGTYLDIWLLTNLIFSLLLNLFALLLQLLVLIVMLILHLSGSMVPLNFALLSLVLTILDR